MEAETTQESDAKESAKSTPSRVSLAALCKPNGSPLPTVSNGVKAVESTQADEDVSMNEAGDSMREGEEEKDGEEEAAASTPAIKGKARQEDDVEEGDEEEEEGEEEDDDEEEDEDDDDDDDEEEEEEDDEEEGSDSGTFQSVSDMEGVEGDKSAKAKSPSAAANGHLAVSSETAQASSDDAQGSTTIKIDEKEGNSTSPLQETNKTEAPKKKRPRRRSPSIDLALPVGPPPRPTIRMKLTIAHTDEEAYLTNVPEEIYNELKDKNHAWADWYASTLPGVEEDIDTEAGPDLSELGGLAKLLEKYPEKPALYPSGRKKKRFDEYDIGQYDTRDPFVDDSELGVDEPTHSAKPSADGFFVTQGEVELQKAIAAAKDMRANLQSNQSTSFGKRAPIPVGFGQSVDGGGGAGAVSLQLGLKPENVAIVDILLAQQSADLGMISPAAKDDESRRSYFDTETTKKTPSPGPSSRQPSQDVKVEGSRQSPIRVDDDDSGHPRASSSQLTSKYPTRPVPPRLEREFDLIRQKVAKESWIKKSKFPPSLRDPLLQASQVALALNEYNDNFFNWLPRVLPYNRLTLHKYTKRQFLTLHTDFMKKLQDVNLAVFESQIKQALPILRQEYEEAKGNGEGGPSQSNGISSHGAEEEENPAEDQVENGGQDGEVDGEEEGDKTNKGEPVKRWRWSEPMREVLFTIVTIDNAIIDLKTEKNTLEGSSEKASITNARKLIYKKVFELWPESDWTTTTHISREYALYKRKVDRYTLQFHETQGRDINSAILI